MESTIVERFEQQASQHPERVAIGGENGRLGLGQLNCNANQLAHRLLAEDGRNTASRQVGLLLDHGVPMVEGLLAVLKAGKTCVPLNPALEPKHLSQIVGRAEIDVLLASESLGPLARELAGEVRSVVCADHPDRVRQPTTNVSIERRPDEIAFVLFTSGSTGAPKGVVHTHRTIMQNIFVHTSQLAITADDVVTVASPLHHVSGITDTLKALLNAAQLVPLDMRSRELADIAASIETHAATVVHLVPTVVRRIVRASRSQIFPSLRVLHLGGEPVTRLDFELYQKHFSDTCFLLNNLGCTEAPSYRQCFLSKTSCWEGQIVPVGYPVPGKAVRLRNSAGELFDVGEGEITVTSLFLSPGYWRDEEQTRASFLVSETDQAVRTYCTGDLGQLSPAGCLRFIGRSDDRVKVLGQWVDLAGVEALLLEHEHVDEAAVVPAQNTHSAQLIAYFVSSADSSAANDVTAEIRAYLRQRLPAPMIPQRFEQVPRLPDVGSGKTDRVSISARAAIQLSGENECRTDTERWLARTWSEEFDVDNVMPHDDFFALGGDSLSGIGLLLRIEREMGVKLQASHLIAASSLAALAKQIEANTRQRGQTCLVKASESAGTGIPICFLDVGDGSALRYRHLAQSLASEHSIYYVVPEISEFPPGRAIQTLASSCIEPICETLGNAPFCLLGYSAAGRAAHELARQLSAKGQQTELLALIDSKVRRRERSNSWRLQAANLPYFILDDLLRSDSSKVRDRLAEALRRLRILSKQRPAPHEQPVESDQQDLSHRRTSVTRDSQSFVPGTYSGSALLFRIRGQPPWKLRAHDYGWASVVSELGVIRMPHCDHATILDLPHAQRIAAALSRRLKNEG